MSDDLYMLTITGFMNPALHHPTWYRLVEAITPAEEEYALQKGGATLVPGAFAAFSAGPFNVHCDQGKWSITTSAAEHFRRIVKVGCSVFEKLFETPVTAYFFDFNATRELSVPNVSEYLAALVRSIPVGFSADPHGGWAQLSYRFTSGGRPVMVRLEPSVRSPRHVALGVNVMHLPQDPTGAKRFSLTPHLLQASDRDLAEAEAVMNRVVEDLERGKSNAASRG